jgi:TRAP-type C4-dicarboxylate transport system permease small subunit
MNRLSAIAEQLFNALATFAALVLLGMVTLVTADIVLRNALGSGFAWANEMTEYGLYLTTLLTAPWLLRRGQHVRIDMILVIVPPRIAWLAEAAADVFGFSVSVLLLWYGAAMTAQSARLGSMTIKSLVFPEWWLYGPLPLCFALLALEFVLRFHRLLGAPRARRHEATSVG